MNTCPLARQKIAVPTFLLNSRALQELIFNCYLSIYKKIQYVLNKKQKTDLIFIFFLILIGVFFEILGIGMIIPVMNVIVENDIQGKYPSLIYLWEFLGFPEKKELIIYALVFLLLVYGIKNLFLIYIYSIFEIYIIVYINIQ